MPALRAFASALDCVLVVTQPDRPAGRGHKLQPTPVKAAAAELGIPTFEPERLRGAAETLRACDAALFAVASYGKIVPQALLDVPPLGALNVHPSLLPLYRGATPLQSQLRDGVVASGVTIIRMDAGMDTGDIVLQARSEIAPDETYGELHDRFAALGAELLAQAVAETAAGTARPVPQAGLASDAEIARTLTRPLGKEDLVVDWSAPAQRVVDLVRSLSPAPGARAHLDGEGEAVKILKARLATSADVDELRVTCGDGRSVVIETLVPPNRKAMPGRIYALAAR